MLTVDCIVISSLNETTQILLVRRGKDPFAGQWALPGGFVDQDEDLPEAARRELKEETGIECEILTQFKTYGTPGRDPRGHTVSVVFSASVLFDQNIPLAGDDAAEVQWFEIQNIPQLAFDHNQIIDDFISSEL